MQIIKYVIDNQVEDTNTLREYRDYIYPKATNIGNERIISTSADVCDNAYLERTLRQRWHQFQSTVTNLLPSGKTTVIIDREMLINNLGFGSELAGSIVDAYAAYCRLMYEGEASSISELNHHAQSLKKAIDSLSCTMPESFVSDKDPS